MVEQTKPSWLTTLPCHPGDTLVVRLSDASDVRRNFSGFQNIDQMCGSHHIPSIVPAYTLAFLYTFLIGIGALTTGWDAMLPVGLVGTTRRGVPACRTEANGARRSLLAGPLGRFFADAVGKSANPIGACRKLFL